VLLIWRVVGVVLVLALYTASILSGPAAGQEAVSDARARMDSIQARLDATTARIEALRTQKDNVQSRIESIQTRVARLIGREARLQSEVVKRAEALYMSGTSAGIETLLGSKSLAEVMDRAEILSQASLDDTSVFVELARAKAELRQLNEDLVDEKRNLLVTTEDVLDESERLQAQFADVKEEYQRLAVRLQRSTPTPSAPVAAPAAPAPAPLLRSTDGMYCPVAGPVAFTDTWGAPRAGHTHQGVDMMAGYGTPIVAIVSGTITYAAYDGSGGNMIFLSGDDGNAYWYMHNQENFVSGGHVSAGQKIASVGDTGNAAGTPHLHFEYHPGGGAAVNPTPLVASIC
jgi:murein DD-endopeptidase MepM/ murein hydrolase activator NlpD